MYFGQLFYTPIKLQKEAFNSKVVYRCSKAKHQLRENKSGLQTNTEGNTSAIRGKQLNNGNTDVYMLRINCNAVQIKFV